MIIDFHCHCFNPKVAQRAVGNLAKVSGLLPLTDGSVEKTTQRFDEWGIDKGVILSIATKPTQQTIVNDWAAEQIGDRFLPFGSIHPDAEDRLDELKRIKTLGLYGVKLHPDYQGFMVEGKKMDEVYNALTQLELPVSFHAGFDCISPKLTHCTPQGAKKVFNRHKDLTMILAHLGGNERWQEVYEELAGLDGNLYFDTSFTANCPDELMEKIINKHGYERILFASDCPWDSPKLISEKIQRLGISDDAKEKIFSGNAIRLLGLSH